MNWVPYAVGPAVTLVLTAAFGHWISLLWALRQKRKELAIAAANEFRRLYGEFFSNWKLWEYSLTTADKHSSEIPWEIMKRATAAEGAVEALLVRLTTERRLSEAEVSTLGKFRQAYQQLRQSVRAGKPLRWSHSSHPEYIAFKQLSTKTAHLLSTSDAGRRPTPDQASDALVRVTDNSWELTWATPAGGSSTPRSGLRGFAKGCFDRRKAVAQPRA